MLYVDDWKSEVVDKGLNKLKGSATSFDNLQSKHCREGSKGFEPSKLITFQISLSN